MILIRMWDHFETAGFNILSVLADGAGVGDDGAVFIVFGGCGAGADRAFGFHYFRFGIFDFTVWPHRS